MQLILIRHADAEPHAARDYDRILTPKGRKQAEKVGAFLHTCGLPALRIVSSPVVRAVQTADLLAGKMHYTEGILQDERLACGMTPEEACALIWDFRDTPALALVGHQPDLGTLLAYLLGISDRQPIAMKKASCAFLELENAAYGSGILQALVPVKQMNG